MKTVFEKSIQNINFALNIETTAFIPKCLSRHHQLTSGETFSFNRNILSGSSKGNTPPIIRMAGNKKFVSP
jgi:hypothetical protein